jgi:hypothetical protein
MNDLLHELDEDLIWGQIWDYLRDRLNMLSAAGKETLHALPQTSKGKHYATCLAIDLTANALIPRQVIEIFENLSDKESDICDRIAHTLSQDQYHTFNCCSLLESPPPAGDAYVTVMEIASFITKFVTPNTGEGLSPDEIDKVLKTYFDGEGDLSSLTKCDLRPSNRIWVMPRSEYTFLLESSKNTSGKVFLDALGLTFQEGHGVKRLPHLVAILYPQGYDCGARQPTSFDPWWGNAHVQFISFYKKDGWGRTHSCTGCRYIDMDDEGMPRERVHRDHSGLEGFTGQSIGHWQPVGNISQHEIFRAALRRFVRARAYKDR